MSNLWNCVCVGACAITIGPGPLSALLPSAQNIQPGWKLCVDMSFEQGAATKSTRAEIIPCRDYLPQDDGNPKDGVHTFSWSATDKLLKFTEGDTVRVRCMHAIPYHIGHSML